MFLVAFIRFLSGYIEFTASGGFSERFINLCSVHDVPLWNLSYHDDYFTACTTIEGYRKIAVCARNSGVKVRKKSTVGIPFIANRLKPRIGLLFGAVFFVLCISILSGKVWMVEISGNSTVPTDIILKASEDAGLKIGTKIKDLNAVQISLDTCKNTKNLSWAAIRVNGCCVHIDVTENEPAKKSEDKSGYYNLVSAKDAQLVILEPYSGTVQVKNFNPVLKGDVLISGTAANRDESVTFTHASGYAVGRTLTNLSSATPTKLSAIKNKLIKKVYYIEFFGIKIPLGTPPEKFSQKFEHSQHISYSDKVLPIGISYEEYYNLSDTDKTISSNRAKLISMSDFMNQVHEFSYGKQIINHKVTIDDYGTVSGEFTCYENIGIEIPFEIEESQ